METDVSGSELLSTDSTMSSTVFPSLFNSFVVLETETTLCTKRILSETSTLSAVVADLGPILTHAEPSRRQSGLEFLSKVMDKLPSGHLSTDECHFFARFYVDRSNDSPLMYSSVVLGFGALVLNQGRELKDDDLLAILRVITGELHTQSLTVNDRSRVFDIFSWCICHKLEVLQRPDFSSQFVHGFLQAVEGETNPRNLHVIFSCWPVVIQRLDSNMFAEDIFEVLSCYFPIDFSPPRGTSVKITKEDLSSGLHACLAATPNFAEFAIPLFLEKLDSDLVESKIDALICFRLCIQEYAPSQLKNHLKPVWNSCKQEIMGIRANTNEEVVKNSLHLLRSVCKQLCNATQSAENVSVLETWIDIAWADLKPFLKFVESNLMETAVSILCCFCSSDKLTSEPILNRTIPILMDVQKTADDKARIVEMIYRLLDICQPLNSAPDWAPQFLTLCEMGCLSSDQAWCEVSHGALQLASEKLSYALIDDFLLECFNRAIRNETVLRSASMKSLALTVAKFNIEAISAWCDSVPITVQRLKDLEILAALCINYDEILKKKLPELINALSSKDQIFLTALMLSFQDIVVSAKPEGFELLVLEHDILNRLANICCSDDKTIKIRNSLMSKITSSLQDEKYNSFIVSVTETFITAKNDEFMMSHLASVLCSLHPKLLEKQPQMTEKIFANSLEPTDSLMRVRGSLLNKIAPTQTMSQYLSILSQTDAPFAPNTTWIIKGLVMRGSKEANPLIEKMMIQLRKNLDDEEVVRGYLSLVQDSADFTPANNHRILPFYRQKVFNLTFPTLMQWFRDGEKKVLDVILLQLPHIPKSIVETEVSPVLPLLVEALFNSKSTTLTPAMSSFLAFIKEVDPSLLQNLSEVIIPFLLNVACADEAGMEDKISSLKVLESLAGEKCPKEVKRLVINKSSVLLNHRKRLVRRAAADARNSWMIL